MRARRLVVLGAACLALASPGAFARKPAAGGGTSRNIVEDAGSLHDASTFAAGIKAAGLTDTLSGPGPFTVFLPTNDAFDKLPGGTVDNLMRPENKAQLQTVLSYHVVPGALTTRDLVEQVRAGGGKATLKTVQGEPLTAEIKGRAITITDVKGGVAHLTATNISASNGVVHTVNAVLLP